MANNRSVSKSLLWTLAIWCAHLLALLVVTVVFITAIQRQVDMLAQMDADLPPASMLAFSIVHYFVDFWYTLLVPVVIDAGVLATIALLVPKLNWLAWLWSTLWLLGLVLLLAFVTLAIALPLAQSLPGGLS